MKRFKEEFPIFSRIIIAIIVLAILFLLAWGGWTLAYNQGWVQHAPTLNFASLADHVEEREAPPAQPEQPAAPVEPTAPPPPASPTAPAEQVPEVPLVTPEPIYVENVVYVTPEPTQPPVEQVVQPIVITPTEKTISFKVENKKHKLTTFTYAGGWVTTDDPWYVAIVDNLEKEIPEAYGVPIQGELWSDKVQNFMIATCADPWSLTWFRFQMGLENFNNMEEVNNRVWELIGMGKEEYDRVANETLDYFFKKLDGGRIETSKDWNLEVMLRYIEDDDADTIDPELFSRVYSDTNNKPDLLVTFYAKGAKNTFVSNKKALEVAAAFAGVSNKNYSQRTWFNFTEGGTPKWKANGKNNPPPGGNTPTPTPGQNTPTPTPETPTPTPRPTKDPSQRPTVSDAPVGGGPTNPENSTDPHTTDHVESTPAPAVVTPAPATPAPTAVPTAVVRPTEVCETEAPPPIREDTYTPPPSNPDHNVPQTETQGQGDDSFDPDSI